VKFRWVPEHCGVKIELATRALSLLHDKLTQLYRVQQQGIEPGDQSYLVAKQGQAIVIDDSNKATAIQALLDQGHTQDFWEALTNSDPDLATRLAMAKIEFDRREAIREYESALVTHAENEGYWQNLFKRHPWMLQSAFSSPVIVLNGESYVGGKRPIGRQGAGGVATDFLLSDESTKSFAVVEIKTPATSLVGRQYRGERDSGYDSETYSMSRALSGSIVQARNQIAVAVRSFGLVIGAEYGHLNHVHPKGVVIIGSADALSDRQKDSFNHFRQELFSLTVITYDELLCRLKLLFGDGPQTQPIVEDTAGTENFDFDEPPF
jgi:hypothetical protein